MLTQQIIKKKINILEKKLLKFSNMIEKILEKETNLEKGGKILERKNIGSQRCLIKKIDNPKNLINPTHTHTIWAGLSTHLGLVEFK